jgi:hypothetical protein
MACRYRLVVKKLININKKESDVRRSEIELRFKELKSQHGKCFFGASEHELRCMALSGYQFGTCEIDKDIYISNQIVTRNLCESSEKDTDSENTYSFLSSLTLAHETLKILPKHGFIKFTEIVPENINHMYYPTNSFRTVKIVLQSKKDVIYEVFCDYIVLGVINESDILKLPYSTYGLIDI